MPRVLNGNLIVLKWQNIHVISNIKYTAIYIYIYYIYKYIFIYIYIIYIYIYILQNLVKQVTLHSAEAYSEPFQRLSKEVISLEVTIFTKKPILDV